MLTNSTGLAASYGRRAIYTTLCAAAMGGALIGARMVAGAQDAAPPAVPAAAPPAKAPAQTPKTGTKKKPAAPSLKVVPIPRTDGRAADPQAPANGAAPNPQGGGAPGPGGAGGGVRGGAGGFGQFGQGFPGRRGPRGGTGDPSGGMFSGRGTTFQFEFHGADITNVLKLYSMMSGLTITTDPTLTGPVTIINNAKPVTLDEAFRILQSVLSVRGFTALQNGNVLSIIPLPLAAKQSTFVSPDPETVPTDARDQVMTQVIPLENVDALQLSKDLLPLINTQASIIGSAGTNSLIVTDTASSVRRIIALVNALDKTSSRTELKVYPLRHAEATNVASTITDLYKQITPRATGGPPNPQQPMQPGQQPGGANARPAVIAVPDTRTNSVLVVASPDNQEQIARDIISRLDDDDSALETEVIKIKYSNAQDVANLVNNVLSNMHGAPQQNSRQFGGFNPFGFGGFGGGGGNNSQGNPSNDPFGQVTADPRTNSLFVTANGERMARIKDLIKQIDVDVPVETTTFVIPLKNAKADDVAYALSQAFRTTNSTGGGGGFNPFGFGGGNNQTSRPGQNNTSSRQNGRTGTGGGAGSLPGLNGRSAGRSAPPPPNAPDGGNQIDPSAQDNGGSAIPQGVAGVMTDQGFVPTDTDAIKAAQEAGKTGAQSRQIFGGFGGGRRQGVGQTNQPQYGRGNNGTYSNLLQLQDNVFVTPSPDGESLIVTTTPDNYRALKSIVDQLDVIPKQVMVEVIVAEVTLDSDQKFGFDLNSMLFRLFSAGNKATVNIAQPANGFGPSPTAIDPAQSGLQFLLSGTNYSAILQALNTDNKVKVMSTPRIFTSNAQQATIDINTYVPYINGQTTNGAVTGGSAFVSTAVQYLPIGVTISVTPRITRDGRVTMDLTQDLSDLVQFDQLNTGQGTIRAPRYNLRHADTSVTVADGQTVVVGGLIRDSSTLTTSKTPLLGDLPLLGQFFRSREKVSNKVELVFFVTPHVVATDENAKAISKQVSSPLVHQMPEISKMHPDLAPTPDPTKDKKDKKDKTAPAPQDPQGGSTTTTPPGQGPIPPR